LDSGRMRSRSSGTPAGGLAAGERWGVLCQGAVAGT
jgi:hypothetical protein